MAVRSICSALAIAVVAADPTSEATVARFSAKIVGNSANGRVARHAFVVGDGYTDVFRDNRRARTAYALCW